MSIEEHEHDHKKCEKATTLRETADMLERRATEGLVGLPRLRKEHMALAAKYRNDADELEK